MKERPILFSAAMVCAILDGRKTQTRRIVKPRPTDAMWDTARANLGGDTYRARPAVSPSLGLLGLEIERYGLRPMGFTEPNVRCPYGRPGDQLWVRENWRVGAWFEDDYQICVDYQADGHCRRELLDVPEDLFIRLWHQSTDDARRALGERDRYVWEPGESPCRWRPSIHMPRWASRITLEITGVRVERLQEISEEDAEAEGAGFEYCEILSCSGSYRGGYANLWERINGNRSWDANPWVWVVEFKRADARP